MLTAPKNTWTVLEPEEDGGFRWKKHGRNFYHVLNLS